jgi:hypothetical protein
MKKKRRDFRRLEFAAGIAANIDGLLSLLGRWRRAAQQIGKHAALFGRKLLSGLLHILSHALEHFTAQLLDLAHLPIIGKVIEGFGAEQAKGFGARLVDLPPQRIAGCANLGKLFAKARLSRLGHFLERFFHALLAGWRRRLQTARQLAQNNTEQEEIEHQRSKKR